MNARVISPTELDGGLIARWREVQSGEPGLASPYFCPEFTQAVRAVRSGVRVAVLEDAGRVVGFFPFERGRFGVGMPVGGRLCDYQAVIVERQVAWDAARLLDGCRLAAFDFDHLLASQEPFRPYHLSVAPSHYVNLRGGFGAYAGRLQAAGSELLKKHAQSIRRMEREVGPVRFQAQAADSALIRRVTEWKSLQYQRSGLIDIFAFDWTVALLERIHGTRQDTFSGMLSALYLGDRLAAVHMGMRSWRVWHWWFPAHDPDLHRYSPGMVLLLEAIRHAASLGLESLDLGKGDSFYKDRLKGDVVMLAEGRVERPGVVCIARRFRRDLEGWVRHSALLPLARWPGRVLKQRERKSALR